MNVALLQSAPRQERHKRQIGRIAQIRWLDARRLQPFAEGARKPRRIFREFRKLLILARPDIFIRQPLAVFETARERQQPREVRGRLLELDDQVALAFGAHGERGRAGAARVVVAGAADDMRLSVPLSSGWRYLSGATGGATTHPASGDVSLLEWTWKTPPVEPVAFTYVLDAPANQAVPDSLDALLEVRSDGARTKLLLNEATDAKQASSSR